MKSNFACIPGASFITCYLCFGVVFSLLMAYNSFIEKDIELALFFIVFSSIIVGFLVWQWKRTMWRVKITSQHLICYAPLCRDVLIPLNECQLGFGYHLQGDKKVWWIYVCNPDYKFDTRKMCSRMNTLKCEKGFVRMMYRYDLFMELIKQLPRNKQDVLLSAKRFYQIE